MKNNRKKAETIIDLTVTASAAPLDDDTADNDNVDLKIMRNRPENES